MENSYIHRLQNVSCIWISTQLYCMIVKNMSKLYCVSTLPNSREQHGFISQVIYLMSGVYIRLNPPVMSPTCCKTRISQEYVGKHKGEC